MPSEQSDDLTKLISEIQGKQKSELDKILAEADAKGKGDILRSLWQQDVKDFHRDQGKNSMNNLIYMCALLLCDLGSHNKGNRWSMVTIRLGTYVYSRLFNPSLPMGSIWTP